MNSKEFRKKKKENFFYINICFTVITYMFLTCGVTDVIMFLFISWAFALDYVNARRTSTVINCTP